VSMPVNDGAANTRGIELEAKLPLRQHFRTALQTSPAAYRREFRTSSRASPAPAPRSG